jgi:hypothetical protein
MNLSPLPIQKFFGNNGRPLAGGLLFTYEAGTSTKVATYTDASGSIQNTNPIVLDFRGECRLWLDPKQSYKIVLSPPGDTDPPTRPIWTVDDITVAPQAFDNAADDIGTVNNISLIIPQVSSPVAFTRIVFKAAHTNTGPTTLQVNGGTAHDVTLQSGQPLSGGEITGGGIYEAIFDGANWQLQSQLKFPRTDAENAAGVTPVNLWEAPGVPERYATNTTPGTTDMSAALTAANAQAAAGGAPIVCRSVLHIPTKVVITGRFETPRVQCFTPSSIVVFAPGSVDAILPEWWGAVPDAAVDGSGTDSTAAFEAAITASTLDGDDAVAIHPIVVSAGNYLVGNLVWPPATSLRGQGRLLTNFIAHDDTTGKWFTDNGSAAKIVMEGFAMYGRGLTAITHGLQLGRNGVQHGVEGHLVELWVRDMPNAKLIDVNGNVGFYQRLAAYDGKDGITIVGIANQASELVSLGCTGVSAELNLVDVTGLEIEAPANGSLPLYLSGNASVNGLIISLANNTTLSHLVEFGANATTWSITNFHLGTASTGVTVTNGNFKRSDGSYFGGNATSNNRAGEGNYSSDTQGMRKQCFKLRLINSGGTLQHRITDGGGNPTKFASLINGASSALTNTPTGTDSSTAMAAGGKIGSASPSVFWFDTPPQVTGYDLMNATECISNTGDNIRAVTLLQSININGVTRTRLGVQLWNMTGAANYNINTTNLAPGEFVDIKLDGYLAS